MDSSLASGALSDSHVMHVCQTSTFVNELVLKFVDELPSALFDRRDRWIEYK